MLEHHQEKGHGNEASRSGPLDSAHRLLDGLGRECGAFDDELKHHYDVLGCCHLHPRHLGVAQPRVDLNAASSNLGLAKLALVEFDQSVLEAVGPLDVGPGAPE